MDKSALYDGTPTLELSVMPTDKLQMHRVVPRLLKNCILNPRCNRKVPTQGGTIWDNSYGLLNWKLILLWCSGVLQFYFLPHNLPINIISWHRKIRNLLNKQYIESTAWPSGSRARYYGDQRREVLVQPPPSSLDVFWWGIGHAPPPHPL